MQKARALMLAALTLAAALGGCIGILDSEVTAKQFSASGGVATDGYDPAGSTLSGASASLEGHVDDPANTGSINLSFTFAGSQWEVSMQEFTGEEAFKDGGVEFDLVEHGDTGVSSPAIPRIDGEIVTYGPATVLRDGEPATDPEGNTGPWSAHLMLTRDTVRGPDGQITTADGSAPYDPANPGDARIITGDKQAILQLIAPSGPDSARAPAQNNHSVTLQGPMSSQSFSIEAAPGASLVLNMTASGGDSPLAAGDISVKITAGNQTLASDAGQVGPNQNYENSFTFDGLNASTVDVMVQGNGTYQVDAQSTVTYDDHPFVVLWFDDYTTEVLEEN